MSHAETTAQINNLTLALEGIKEEVAELKDHLLEVEAHHNVVQGNLRKRISELEATLGSAGQKKESGPDMSILLGAAKMSEEIAVWAFATALTALSSCRLGERRYTENEMNSLVTTHAAKIHEHLRNGSSPVGILQNVLLLHGSEQLLVDEVFAIMPDASTQKQLYTALATLHSSLEGFEACDSCKTPNTCASVKICAGSQRATAAQRPNPRAARVDSRRARALYSVLDTLVRVERGEVSVAECLNVKSNLNADTWHDLSEEMLAIANELWDSARGAIRDKYESILAELVRVLGERVAEDAGSAEG